MKALFFAVVVLFSFAGISSARFITLVGRVANGTNYFDTITIGTNEVAEVRSFFEFGFRQNQPFSSAYLLVQRGDNQFDLTGHLFLNGTNALRQPLIIAGPASLTLKNSVSFPAFVTVEVKTEAFPPDKTLIVPGDSNGANVILESSTDLVNWSSASPGAYTNRTNNLFFRIRAERLP